MFGGCEGSGVPELEGEATGLRLGGFVGGRLVGEVGVEVEGEGEGWGSRETLLCSVG